MKKILIMIMLLYPTISWAFTYYNSTSSRLYINVLGYYVAAHDTFETNYRISKPGINFIDYSGCKESVLYSNIIYFPIVSGTDTFWMDTISVPYDSVEVIELMPSDTIMIYANDTTYNPLITTNAVSVTQKNTIARIILNAYKRRAMAIEVHMFNKSYLR